MSSSTPDTQATRNLLHALRGNILRNPRVLSTFERFTGLPQLLTAYNGESAQYRRNIFVKRVVSFSSVSDYFRDCFPTLAVTPERYVATYGDSIRTDLLIHHAINAALARNSEDLLLQFLVVAVGVHVLGHTLRNSLWAYRNATVPMEEYPFFCESPAMSSTYVDTGFEAEIAIFGGILGVVFEDERSSDATFPFFQLDYTRIAYFCLTTPTNVTYKIDAKTIRSRMRSPEWLDTFDVSSMDIIEKPPFFQHRLCALLNSTHIPRPDDKVLARHGQTSTSILNDEIARAGPFPAYFNPRLRRSRVCIIRSGGPGLTQ